MDTKHTPGPWTVHFRAAGGVTSAIAEELDGESWPFVVHMPDPPWAFGKCGAAVSCSLNANGMRFAAAEAEARANARLIAAAPDLLAAAQSARISIQACEGTRMPLVLGVALSLSLKSLLAAIAKAEGR